MINSKRMISCFHKITLAVSVLFLFSMTIQAQTATSCSSKAVKKSCAIVCSKDASFKKTATTDMVKSLFAINTGCTKTVAAKNMDARQCATKKPCDPPKCDPCPVDCCEAMAKKEEKKAKTVTASLVSIDQ